MIAILIDANLTGQAPRLWGTLEASGWLELVAIEFVTFPSVALPFATNDRLVWRFAQERQQILLTDNRNMSGLNSLERTLREELLPTSLPVLTISQRKRLAEREYRERCVERLIAIILNLDNLRGTPRLYLP